MKAVCTLIIGAALALPARGDIVLLKNGGKFEGVVVRESDGEITLRVKYGLVTVDKEEIETIVRRDAKGAGETALRLARWDHCVKALAPKPWDGAPRQVPAPVIDDGLLRNVPYISFRSGRFEFNLYGDPDAPAAFEFGIFDVLHKDEAARKKCLDALAELLGRPADREALAALGSAPGRKELDGLLMDVAVEEAEGGSWWVSVVDPTAVEKARASKEELDRISASREEARKEEEAAKAAERARRAEEQKLKDEEKKARAEERRQAAQTEAGKPYESDKGGVVEDDDVVWAGYVWRAAQIDAIRRRPRPTPYTRYYSPGYSRTGGSYRAGPRLRR